MKLLSRLIPIYYQMSEIANRCLKLRRLDVSFFQLSFNQDSARMIDSTRSTHYTGASILNDAFSGLLQFLFQDLDLLL